MGHSSSNPAHLHNESRLAAARCNVSKIVRIFTELTCDIVDDDEIFILKKTWQVLIYYMVSVGVIFVRIWRNAQMAKALTKKLSFNTFP